MRGAFQRALRLAMDEVWKVGNHSVLCHERGWKLFLLIPRMLLSRPPSTWRVDPTQQVGVSSCSIDCRRKLD